MQRIALVGAITLSILLCKFAYHDYFSAVPATTSAPEFEAIPAYEKISASGQIIRASGSIPSTETTAEEIEVEYKSSGPYLWKALTEYEWVFWCALVFMVPILMRLLILSVRYRRMQRVLSCKGSARGQCEDLLLELGAIGDFIQGLSERCATMENCVGKVTGVEHERNFQFQKKMDSLKWMSNKKPETHTQFQSESESVKTNLNSAPKEANLTEIIKEAVEHPDETRRDLHSIITMLEERCGALENDLYEIHKGKHKIDYPFQNEVESLNVQHGPRPEFRSENVSMKTNIYSVHKAHDAVQKETASTEIIEEEDGYPGDSLKDIESMKAVLLKLIQELRAEGNTYIDSIEIVVGEDEKLPDLPQNEVNSTNTMKRSVEEERPSQLSNKIESTKKMIEMQHKPQAQFSDENNLMNTVREFGNERRSQIQNVVKSVHLTDRTKEQLSDSQNVVSRFANEMGSVSIMKDKLHTVLEDPTASDQTPTEPYLKTGRCKKFSINSYSSGGEKEREEVTKTREGWEPSRIPSEVTGEIVSHRNTIPKRGEIQVKKIHNEMPDYTKAQPKVSPWRQGDEHVKAREVMKLRCDRLAGRVIESGSPT
jgi:hypothetical protein